MVYSHREYKIILKRSAIDTASGFLKYLIIMNLQAIALYNFIDLTHDNYDYQLFFVFFVSS